MLDEEVHFLYMSEVLSRVYLHRNLWEEESQASSRQVLLLSIE